MTTANVIRGGLINSHSINADGFVLQRPTPIRAEVDLLAQYVAGAPLEQLQEAVADMPIEFVNKYTDMLRRRFSYMDYRLWEAKSSAHIHVGFSTLPPLYSGDEFIVAIHDTHTVLSGRSKGFTHNDFMELHELHFRFAALQWLAREPPVDY